MQGSMPTARSRTSTPRCRGPAAKRSEKQSRRKASCSPRLPRVGFLQRRSRSTSSPTKWLAIARHEKSTRYQTEIFLDRHVRPALGKKRIEKIGPSDLNRLYLDLEAGSADRKALAPSTVVRIHGIIRACL